MTESSPISVLETDARTLANAAIGLSSALAAGDTEALRRALGANLELWLAIRAAIITRNSRLPVEVQDNLARLSQFVETKTALLIEKTDADIVENLVSINLQLSEGLLEGLSKAAAGL